MNQPRIDLSLIVLTSPGDTSWTRIISDFTLLSNSSEMILVGSKPQSDLVESVAKKAGTLDRTFWLHVPDHRAKQLNQAIQKSRCRWIWILTPECRFSSRTLAALETAISQHPSSVFFFERHWAESTERLATLNSLTSNLRAKLLKLPFMNQGICTTREIINLLGGFDENLTTQEDSQFIYQARLKGIDIRGISAPLWVSTKKYAREGWLSPTLQELQEAWDKTFPAYFTFIKKRWFS